MKAYIVHGWDGNPDEPVLKWLRLELQKKGWEVEAPAMPEPENPRIEPWVGKLREIVELGEDVVLVGHSVGCQAVLRYLESLSGDIKIKGLVLLAPWMELDKQTIEEEGEEVVEMARPWMETSIDFKKVKNHTQKVIAIFSDDDPYVPVSQADFFEKKLGAEILIEHHKGHFSPSDEVKELPSLLAGVLRV